MLWMDACRGHEVEVQDEGDGTALDLILIIGTSSAVTMAAMIPTRVVSSPEFHVSPYSSSQVACQVTRRC